MEKKKKINFRRNLKIYWGFIQQNKWMFYGTLGLGFIMELISGFTKYVFKSFIDLAEKSSDGFLNIDMPITTAVLYCAIALLLSTSTRSILKWIQIHYIILLDTNLIYAVKQKYFKHIIKLSHSFHTSHKSGSLISKLTRAGGAIEGFTDQMVFNYFPLIFQILIVATAFWSIHWLNTVTLFGIAIAFIGFSQYINMQKESASIEQNDTEDLEKGNLGDALSNVDSIKLFGKEEWISKKYDQLSNNSRKAQVSHWKYERTAAVGQVLIIGLGTISLMAYPTYQYTHNNMSLGDLVFVWTLYGNLVIYLFGVVWALRHTYNCLADFESLFSYEDIQNEIEDKPNALSKRLSQGSIVFDNVSFGYKSDKLFKNLNLKIEPNEKIALVGPSGSGKSTLVKLLFRLYDVSSGQILIDGVPINHYDQEFYRSELSIVPQECILFDDSMRNNILFSNEEATDEELHLAIKAARLQEVVDKLSDGLETIVGERGVKLSGGEKQRVSIARALLANRKILVLDEATSALDTKTEFQIQKDLELLLENRTSIMIAHRLSTIMNADRIIVMDKGHIVEQGSHEDLLIQDGLYKQLWSMQQNGFISEEVPTNTAEMT